MTMDARPMVVASQHRPRLIGVLEWILGLLALGALQGGLAMVVDPVQPLGMSADFLEGTPISTYVWPGIFLLAIAVASALTVIGLLFDWRWKWAAGIESTVGCRWPWLGLVSIGTVLLAFEVLELFIIPFHPVMHPMLIGVSVTIVGLATTSSVRKYLRTPSVNVGTVPTLP